MNVLLVTGEFPPSPRSAGIGSYTSDLAAGLVRSGVGVVVLTASDRVWTSWQKEYAGYKVVAISGGDFFIGSGLLGKFLNRIRRRLFWRHFRLKMAATVELLCKEHAIDIIEVPEYGALSAFFSSRILPPHVVRFHGPSSLNRFAGKIDSDTGENFELETTGSAAHHTFVSKALRDVVRVSNHYPVGVPSSVLYNSVDIQERNPWLVDEIKEGDNVISVVAVGSLGSIKGFDILLQACRELSFQGICLELHFYGRGADLERSVMQAEMQLVNGRQWVFWHGQIDREKLPLIYKNADICCFPSWFEPFGLTVLEAMHCQGLVVASRFGGWSEVIEDGQDGFLCDPREGATGLVKILKHVLTLSKEERRNIARAAHQKIHTRFGFESFIALTANTYSSIISQVDTSESE